MAATLDARLRLNSAEFTGGLNRAARETNAFIGRISQQFASLRNIITGGALGVSGGFLIGDMLGTAAEYEKYERMLAQVSGGANAAKLELSELRKIAMLPGIDLESAVTATVRLRMMGKTTDEVRDNIAAIANKVAELGGGGAQMQGVLLGLSQIAAKGKVSAEELNQIAERIPSIRNDMKELFGTGNSEEIQAMNISAQEFIDAILNKWGQAKPMVSGLTEEIKNFKMTLEQLKAYGGSVFAPLVEGGNKAMQVFLTLHRAARNFLDNVFNDGTLQHQEWAERFAGEMERRDNDAKIAKATKLREDEERKKKLEMELKAFQHRRTQAVEGMKDLEETQEGQLDLVNRQLAEYEDLAGIINAVNDAYENGRAINEDLLAQYQEIVRLTREKRNLEDAINRKKAEEIRQRVADEMLEPRERKRRMREKFDEDRARRKVIREEENRRLKEEEKKARKNMLDDAKKGEFWDKDEARKRIRENMAKEWKDIFKDSREYLKNIDQTLRTLATA